MTAKRFIANVEIKGVFDELPNPFEGDLNLNSKDILESPDEGRQILDSYRIAYKIVEAVVKGGSNKVDVEAMKHIYETARKIGEAETTEVGEKIANALDKIKFNLDYALPQRARGQEV